VSDDSENFAAGAVRFQSAAAKFARRVESESGAGDIDFAGDSASQPAFLFMASRAAYVDHFANEFVSGGSAKIVVAAEDFDVGVADAREANADDSPAAAEGWQWFAGGGEGLVFCDEGEHVGLLLTKKSQIGNFRFQMEETAKASPFEDIEVRASYARLSPGRPGKPGLGKAAASHRTPYGPCRGLSNAWTRDFDAF